MVAGDREDRAGKTRQKRAGEAVAVGIAMLGDVAGQDQEIGTKACGLGQRLGKTRGSVENALIERARRAEMRVGKMGDQHGATRGRQDSSSVGAGRDLRRLPTLHLADGAFAQKAHHVFRAAKLGGIGGHGG